MENLAELNLELNNHLCTFIPNPCKPDLWYDATLLNGKPAKVKFTQGAGRNARKFYLHVAMSQKVSLKTPTGEVLSTWREWYLYRAERNSSQPFNQYGEAKTINGELP